MLKNNILVIRRKIVLSEYNFKCDFLLSEIYLHAVGINQIMFVEEMKISHFSMRTY